MTPNGPSFISGSAQNGDSDAILAYVGDLTLQLHETGFHCSEAIFRAVGSIFLSDVISNETILRMAMVFRGGMAATMSSHCGGLTVGLLVIGALYGRIDPNENAALAPGLARMYWKQFLDFFKTSHCSTLRREEPGLVAPTRCGGIMVQSARLMTAFLLDLERAMPAIETIRSFRVDRSEEPCHEQIVPLLPFD